MELIEHLERLFHRYGGDGAAHRLGVDVRTLRRWRRGETSPRGNLPAQIILQSRLAAGDLTVFDAPGWDGWTLGRDGLIYPPGARDGHPPADVGGIHWQHQLIRELKRQISEQQTLIEALQEQPAAGTPAPHRRFIRL